MDGKTIGIVAVVLIVIASGWYLLQGSSADTPPTTTTPTDQTSQTTGTSPSTATTTTTTTTSTSGPTVVLGDRGFTPASMTIPLGATVMFVNQSTGNMWVASAMHPTHMVYDGTSLSQHCPDITNSAFDECEGFATGNIFSFTFNKAGTWKYHNHVNASQFGTVIVNAAP